jgi:flagellar basal-body rod modification protein FlgD
MQDFLQLLTTQLENQDPLNPMSDTDFFAQMAQLGQVEGIDELNNSAQVQQAQSLMGQTVVAANTNVGAGQPAVVQGVVQALSIQNGTYYLGIEQANGVMATVPMSALQAVEQTPNISGLAGMVGQTVTGTTYTNGVAGSVTGTVTNVGLVNNVPSVTIQPKTGASVTLGLSQITSVSS